MKIVYNVTVKISNLVKDEWLSWMKEEHIPDVMKTGKFLEWRIQRILGDEDPDATTYAIQYIAASMDDFLDYNQHYAKALQEEHTTRYKDKYVAFRTLMEIVEESQQA